MGCFSFFKEKYNNWQQRKPTPAPSSAPATSNNGTSRTEDSSATKPTSKSSGSTSSQRSIPELYKEKARDLREFVFSELSSATGNFSRLRKLGEGGFGPVYKGFIRPISGQGDAIVVAVKKLNPNGVQGHKQWLTEVQFLGVVQHPNLVKLIGFCAVDTERGAQRLLVYEFIPNNTLDEHLFNKAYPCLPWSIRLQIVLGAAEGLLYLHEGLEVQVIYRDFKASNVLLDEEFNPKLSDFGLAREGPSAGHTHVSTAVMGTYGYAAPDYVETGHLTTKSDVWSFGVVLYEILTGRRAMERNRPGNERKLLDWVKQYPVGSKHFSQIVDPRLENMYSFRGAQEIVKLADRCILKKARDRPSMREVVESLKVVMQYKELAVGPTAESVEENLPPDVDVEKRDKQESGVESARRRMLQLAKLRESANAVGRRKFMLMTAGNPT